MDRLIDWLTDKRVNGLIDWLIGCLFQRTEQPILQWMNVIIVGLDSVSRFNMIRTMNRSRHFLSDTLHAVEFINYDKVSSCIFYFIFYFKFASSVFIHPNLTVHYFSWLLMMVVCDVCMRLNAKTTILESHLVPTVPRWLTWKMYCKISAFLKSFAVFIFLLQKSGRSDNSVSAVSQTLLCTMKVSDDQMCSYCNDVVDYIEHFFFDCPTIKNLHWTIYSGYFWHSDPFNCCWDFVRNKTA